MYAVFSIPGSQSFSHFGPAKKTKCEKWLEEKTLKHNTDNPADTQTGRLVSNQVADQMGITKEEEGW